MEKFVNSLGFKVVVMKDREATEKSVNAYFTRLANLSLDHQEKNSKGKLLNLIYYTGHGVLELGT